MRAQCYTVSAEEWSGRVFGTTWLGLWLELWRLWHFEWPVINLHSCMKSLAGSDIVLGGGVGIYEVALM